MRAELCCVTWQAMNIALNNLSLVRISLSLNQVIRWVTQPAGCTQMRAADISIAKLAAGPALLPKPGPTSAGQPSQLPLPF